MDVSIQTGFFQIKNNFTENCDASGSCVLITPEHYHILKITGNNKTQTVIAREGYAFPYNEEYKRFKSLVDEIDRIVITILPHENDENNKTTPPNHSEPKRSYL